MTVIDGAAALRRVRVLLSCLTALAVLAGVAGVFRASPLTPTASAASASAVELTGGGTAFVMGGSGVPLPSDGYVNAANLFYLQPHGFTGTPQSLFTPQLYFPGNVSEVEGAQILADAISKEIATGQVNAENPVYVFGYSQSSAMSSMTMEQLHHQGVSAEDVHFVLVGNTANPNGGLVEMMNFTGGDVSFLTGLTLGHPTPDYFSTDVYTMEYDGYADFPKYPLNLLATLNALAGMLLLHNGYLGLSPSDIANAIELDTTDPSSPTNYYMIPTESLPLLDLLRLNPSWGSPLAALLEPTMRILVNLGYGSLTEGWNQGPANVPTTISWNLLPSNISLSDISSALANAWNQGVQDAFKELADPKTYIPGGFLSEEPFSTLWAAAERVFFDVQDTGSWWGAPAMATDPQGALLDTNVDLSPIADALGLDS